LKRESATKSGTGRKATGSGGTGKRGSASRSAKKKEPASRGKPAHAPPSRPRSEKSAAPKVTKAAKVTKVTKSAKATKAAKPGQASETTKSIKAPPRAGQDTKPAKPKPPTPTPKPTSKSAVPRPDKAAPAAPAPRDAQRSGKPGGGGARPERRSPARSPGSTLPSRPNPSRSRTPGDDEARSANAPVRAELLRPPSREALAPTLRGPKLRETLRDPIRESGLPRRIAHGAILPTLLSLGRNEQFETQIDWALEDRVPAYYLAESILQSYLFVGFPRTINALTQLHAVSGSRRRDLGLSADPLQVPAEIASLDRILGGPGEFGSALKGRRIRLAEGPPMHLESPGEGPGSFERYAREWWRRGVELCRAVYGSQYARLRENLGRIHPELADWMVFEGYGKVLSRPVITPRERELWIVPLLMAQNVPDQLFSHLRGAKNLGVPLGRLRAVVWLASTVTGPEVFSTATEMLAEIERRSEDRREAPTRLGS
jgi:alkylhydroperoxidase/carboxymuconolactone decarboxylase family protein YurZ